jgi:SAM-dependent methyltransferase
MAALTRQFVKLCDVADFTDPQLCAAVGEIEGRSPPRALAERKQWERGMLALALAECGLHKQASVLAIGAGSEPVLFWLANRTGLVTATDIYGEGKFSALEATESMLQNPAALSPVDYPKDHLAVRHMDARRLAFPAGSFDFAYSLSSIEHFGSPADIAGSAAEMGRVLKPGGTAVVVTECLVHLDALDRAPVEFGLRIATLGRKRRAATPRRRVALGEDFTPRELHRLIVGPSGLQLVQPLDLALSAQSWDNLTTVHPGGRLEAATGTVHPHVLLKIHRSVFTSVCLVLQQPGTAQPASTRIRTGLDLAATATRLGRGFLQRRLDVGTRRAPPRTRGTRRVLGEPLGAYGMQGQHNLASQAPGALLPKCELADQDIAIGYRLRAIVTDVLFPHDDSHRSPP